MVAEADSEPQAGAKSPRDRSPAYPSISLKTAIDRLVAFDAKFGRHPAPILKSGLAWGMKEKSSQAAQVLAALKYFGLLEYKGASDDRVAMLTDDGRNFLRAQQADVKAAILKACALRPKAISAYWQRWGADRPIDPICLDQLVLKDGFTQSAAQTFLRVYDDTVAFAKLGADDKVGATGGDDDEESDFDLPPAKPKVGDYVRWETGGGIVMFDSRRVLGLSPDGEFVFVEGSPSGLPIKETVVIEAPAIPISPPPNPFAQTAARIDRADQLSPSVKALPGEVEASSGRLGDGVNYRLLVTGEMKSKQVARLIKLLEAQKEFMAEDEDEA